MAGFLSLGDFSRWELCMLGLCILVLWAESGEGAHFAGLELAMPMGGAGLGLASCAGDGGYGHRESGAVWASGASSWLSEGGDGHGG